MLCAPSSSGCVTTWLVAGPMRFLREEQLDQDFLQGVGGEAAARPRSGDVADPASGLRWQACAFPESVLSFKERCLPLGKSAFYLAAELVARNDVEGTLAVTHTGQARVWLDGKSVIRSDRDPYALGPRTAEQELALKAGQRVRCLVKLGSEGRYLQFFVRVKVGQRAAKPDELAVALPLPAEKPPAAESLVLPSLSVGLARERFVQPGKKTEVSFGTEAGYPICEGQLAATITIADAKGQVVETLKVPPARLADLAVVPAEIPWTPPKAGGSAFFKLTAQVTYEGRELGSVSKTVYSPSDIGQWTADLHKRLLALSVAKKLSRDEMAHVLLKIEKAALLQQGPDLRSFAPDEVYRELETASEWLARLDEGKGLPPIGPGVHECAYMAEQDDSPQPYFLHVPHAVTGGKPLPAIVYLHGYAPWLDKTNWHELSAGLTDQAEARGYVVVAPFARSNTDFMAIGEWDVLQVLRLAQQRVKIDPDRVFLLGYSMGGSGVYTLAAHYPDLWAGSVVMCGRPEHYCWKDYDHARVEPFKRHLLDLEGGLPHIQNYLHVPFLVFQGTADTLVQPERAYRFVERLGGLGYKGELVKLEGQSHWIGDEVFSTPRAFEWMERQRRVAAPKAVSFKTHSLLYSRAYWLTIEAFQRSGEPAEANATLSPGNKLQVATNNVARLVLRPPREHCDPAAPFQVTLNGRATEAKPDPKGELTIEVTPPPPGPLRKTPALCGPIKDAFNRRFLLVYGTTGGEKATEANRTLATRMQKDWYAFAKGFRRAMKDTELTEADIARSNLILFGTPKTHAILAKLAPKLPIRFTDDGYEILGRAYKASETTGLMFIYPNPLAPERYVVVCHGLHYGEKLGENHKHDLLPDFILYSDEPDYDDSNAFHCAGFFDGSWQLDPKLTWTSDGRAKPKPAAAPQPDLPPAAP
jgi:pimeloyl-ACP methyl ester carboxylesterase